MIAVGIVAANANQKEAIFDCALRLMGEETASRVFDYTISFSTISGNPSSMLSQYYNDIVFYSTCADNYLNIAFNNDRHEWINSVTIKLHYTQFTEVPHQFVLKARNENDGWTALKAVTGLTWSQIGQAQTIYFLNNKAYHEYRFENFATGDSSDCYWKFNTLDLFSVYTTMTIPELAYDDLIIFKDIKMAEVYPNSEYYTNYQTSPALPDGISIDPNTGMIYGTARIEMEVTTYSITATKLTGGTSTASFSLTVESCTGGRSLVTLVVRTDSFPEQSSYRLYEGIGTSGTVVDSIDRFMLASSLNYAYFCLNDGIYTLELLDSSSNGWSNPAGYYLTVDSGEMIFEMGQVPSGVASVTTMFSSYIPFQIEYTDWKISYNYVEDWNILIFDDSGWLSKKASEIGTNSRITTYIRKEVNIPDISKYHVLNIRVKYAGGVAAYFNGRLVARFNLEEIFDSASKSIAIHNQDTFSKFHVILSTVGGVTGKNIMAFEIHRPLGQSFSSPVIFDATGVFGVNDCSIVVDSYETISSSYPYAGDINELLDLNPTTYGYQPNSPGFCFNWKVENLEGARFNRLGMQTVYTRTNYDFSIFGINKFYTLYYKILQVTDQSTSALERKVWSVPKGTVGFKELRFQLDKAASDTVYLSSYLLLYCKPDGSGICPASGDYPSVGEGEVSLGSCQYGCFGYSYRTCSNGQLGEIKYEYCKQKLPLDLKYNGSKYELVLDINAYIAAPTYTNIIESFYLPSFSYLPDGLQLNKETGEITGVPTETHVSKTFTICGQNQVGTISTTIEISIRKGMCYGDKRFRSVEVGKSSSYDCSRYEPYIGTLSRVCVLGEKDGEWQKTTGICVHVAVVFVIIIVVIILAAVGCTFLTKYRWILKENKRNNTRLTSSLAPSMGPSMIEAIPISDNSSKRIELVPDRTNAVENNGLVNTENDIEKVPNNIGTRVIRV